MLGLLDDVADVLFLADIAFEGGAVDGARHGARRVGIDVGDHHLGGAGAMEGLAHGAPDAVTAARDDHDLAGDLHGTLPAFYLSLFLALTAGRCRAPLCSGRPPRPARSRARSRSGSAAAAMRGIP